MTIITRALAALAGLLLRFRAWRTRPADGRSADRWRAVGGDVSRVGWLGMTYRYSHPHMSARRGSPDAFDRYDY